MNFEDLPKTVERTRQYQGYEVTVLSRTEYIDDINRVVRLVEAQATVDGQEVDSGDLREVASPPGLINRFMAALSGTDAEPHIQITEANHVREVLEDLHEKIRLVQSRGSVDDPSEVDAALDSVFGGDDR